MIIIDSIIIISFTILLANLNEKVTEHIRNKKS